MLILKKALLLLLLFTIISCDSEENINEPSSHNFQQKDFIFSLTWSPSYCLKNFNDPGCKLYSTEDYGAKYFSLHGLWPLKEIYCYLNGKTVHSDLTNNWVEIPKLELSTKTRELLQISMKGGHKSLLHRHEWVKHGSCYEATPEEYFQDSLQLTNEFNDSDVGIFIKKNIGNNISFDRFIKEFETVFGENSGQKINLKCDKNNNILDIYINLKWTKKDKFNLKEMIIDAKTNNFESCQNGFLPTFQ